MVAESPENAISRSWLDGYERKLVAVCIELLQGKVEESPEDPELRHQLGVLLNESGKYTEAFTEFQEAVRLDPTSATYYVNRAEVYLKLGDSDLALEDAGQPLGRLAGSQAGVFVGIHNHSSDYAWLQLSDLTSIDTYTGTGTAHSIVANRLSYLFDLQGPSLTVDTACSSSLVAVHLACQSLRDLGTGRSVTHRRPPCVRRISRPTCSLWQDCRVSGGPEVLDERVATLASSHP